MELEESEIINLAVNIFQNVGIKRYIGHIDALCHEDIYFEIYKIIFPDSMINIFKISQSNRTTGQKIQKIIEEISSIIKLDLYHISGEEIAKGNKNHITNWLQLLEALSNNCIANEDFLCGGGSEPDFDREMYKDFQEEDDYFTVQGVRNQFNKHTYTDEKAQDSDDEEEEEEQEQEQEEDDEGSQEIEPAQRYTGSHKKQNILVQKRESESEVSNHQSAEGHSASHFSEGSNLLQPVGKKGSIKTKKNKPKQVTFKIEEGNKQQLRSSKPKPRKQKDSDKKRTAETSYKSKERTHLKHNKTQDLYNLYSMLKAKENHNYADTLLQNKNKFVLKMHKISESVERKRIEEEAAQFQKSVYTANHISRIDAALIEEQHKSTTKVISKKIADRQNVIDSLAGYEMGVRTIKHLFRKHRHNEKKINMALVQQHKREAYQLMDLRFAAEIEGMVMGILGEIP